MCKVGEWWYVEVDGVNQVGQVRGILEEGQYKTVLVQLYNRQWKYTPLDSKALKYKTKDPSYLRRFIKWLRG